MVDTLYAHMYMCKGNPCSQDLNDQVTPLKYLYDGVYCYQLTYNLENSIYI